MTKKYGYWKTNGLEFLNKVEALLYATKNDTKVKFCYHDEVWKKFDRNLLGKVSLNQLYREQAQRLRDKYKYLVLYYSGGADSHNILMTYINNNIKLDEIIVRWPKALTEGKLYTANTNDTTTRNIWSEWDYAVKPTLEWLRNNHPEIKITIKDYTENLNEKNLESVIENSNHTRGGLLLSFAKTDSNYGKKDIGHIFGVDKPTLAVVGLDVYMFFNDLATSMLYSDKPGDIDPDNIECFYWDPDFPLLTFEMAYQTSEYFNVNRDKRKFLRLMDQAEGVKQDASGFNLLLTLMTQFQNNIVKKICYDTWDNKFQADKSISASRQDKWFWFFECSEFSSLKDVFTSNIKSITNQIDERFLISFNSFNPSVKTTLSDVHFVRKLDV